MEKKNNSKIKCLIFLIICFCVFSSVSGAICIKREKSCPAPLTVEQLSHTNLSNASKLMIVAHPDDETIWGGAHLLDGGYLVVCITNGYNTRRAGEFRKAVEQSGNTPLILDYPDKIFFMRDDWSDCKEAIESDISLVMSAKHWDFAVTHNPKGEYGHIHHKMTNAITVQAFNETDSADKLYFFGDYYKASDIEKAGTSVIPEDIMQKKRELCGIYTSQERTMKKLAHMFPFENWKEYSK
ncbi:MAG: PIG-L family deacetylase [Ruminococcus sp.]|uniref:PIG-L family deacetylase n=1 Tax=Ruminococcus sp. TaxID=41978 RepID=UPI0025F79E4A|nr:PIG-L family deacetylase [Ruminococcus sp.]MCR4796399.1 PIG-L family deacetylase [Ruminococcus sp.]